MNGLDISMDDYNQFGPVSEQRTENSRGMNQNHDADSNAVVEREGHLEGERASSGEPSDQVFRRIPISNQMPTYHHQQMNKTATAGFGAKA